MGNFSAKLPDAQKIAIDDYGHLGCSWLSSGDTHCWGKSKLAENRELEDSLPTKDPNALVLSNEGLWLAVCISGAEGVSCRRSNAGAEKFGNRYLKVPGGSSVSGYGLCYLDGGAMKCNVKPRGAVSLRPLDGALVTDLNYGKEGISVACGAFANGKVRCISGDSTAPQMRVPASIRAP